MVVASSISSDAETVSEFSRFINEDEELRIKTIITMIMETTVALMHFYKATYTFIIWLCHFIYIMINGYYILLSVAM